MLMVVGYILRDPENGLYAYASKNMKRFIAFYLSILFLFPFLYVEEALSIESAIEEIKAPSKISSVMVYSDRAMVTRSASLNLEAGSHIVSFVDLPIGLLEDSIRVTGGGTARAKITGIEFKKTFLEESPEERVKRLEDEIQSLKDELADMDSQVAVLNSQKAFLESIKVGYAERISKEIAVEKPKATELSEVLRFLGENLSNIAAETSRLEIKKRGISSKIDPLMRKLKQLKGEPRKEARYVTVGIDVAKAGDLHLELSYAIRGASWNPMYDIRFSQEGKKVEVIYRGLVSQRTGEDWEDVSLSLSTARPAIGANPPELFPWYVQFSRPSSPIPMMKEGSALKDLKEKREEFEFHTPAEEKASAALPETTQVEEQRSNVVFHVQRREKITSDGFPHNTTISIEDFDVKTEYLSIPRISPFVYLKGEITNNTDYPLLAGKINAFVGMNFTGNAFLNKTIASKERFDLFFGIDEGIKVKREEMKRHKEAGFLGKNRMTYKYRIEAQNFKKEVQRITIIDRIPVPKDEEIKVRLVETSLKPDEVTEQGIIKWVMNLNPQEKKEITFEFQIEYPKDREVLGL